MQKRSYWWCSLRPCYCLSVQGCRRRRGRRLSWIVQDTPRRVVICMHERASSDNYRSNLWLWQKTRPAVKVGDDDNWGTNNLNTCCGKMNVKIPSDIAAGDYLLRVDATGSTCTTYREASERRSILLDLLYTVCSLNYTIPFKQFCQVKLLSPEAPLYSSILVHIAQRILASRLTSMRLCLHTLFLAHQRIQEVQRNLLETSALEPKHKPQVLSAHRQLRKQLQVMGGDTCNGICIRLLNFEREVKVLI
jgi:hypothetical protein